MSLGDRMKAYEKVYDQSIMGRVPIIVRLDGKGFSRWTKQVKADKPFDKDLIQAMYRATEYTANSIEGCMFGYTQSDEVTLVIRNDQSLESTPWFSNRLQKIASVSASMMTACFNERAKCFSRPPLAHFDARVFAVPNIQEAINCLIWRQNDATKNSVSASCYYEVAKVTGKKTARKKMHGLNQKEQQELLFKETGMNWNETPTMFKRGVGLYKITRELEIDGNLCTRSAWTIDKELPIFTQDRSFLENILAVKDSE